MLSYMVPSTQGVFPVLEIDGIIAVDPKSGEEEDPAPSLSF